MKLLILVCMLISFGTASRIISLDDVQTLFTKFVLKQLTNEEHGTFQEVLDILRMPEPLTSLSKQESSDFRLTIDCIICRSAGTAAIQGILLGQSDEELTEALAVICAGVGVSTYKVCHGAVSLNIHIFSYIIKSTPEFSANTLCGLVLQSATNPNACPYNDPRFEWHVELPEAIQRDSIIPRFNDEKPLKVALITDAHIDPLYEPLGVADCDEPTCCRKGQNPKPTSVNKPTISESLLKKSFIEIDGVQMLNLSVLDQLSQKNINSMKYVTRKSDPAGYWGDYRNCDTPKWAFEDVIENINENHGDIDLLYYIGDTIDHGVWETSYELINEMNRYMIEKIKTTFRDNITVIPVIGNHESEPTNQFAPSSITAPKLNTTWLYNALAAKWDYYLHEDAKDSLKKYGSFSMLVRPGFRVISFNNNVPYRFNWWVNYDPLDSKKMLEWLIDELYKAESHGEVVHILTHIPPGTVDLTHTWTREYNRVINRFSSTIAAEFNGHTHMDEFRLFYSPENKPINVAWNVGGITAYKFYNLNYKVAHFNSTTLMPDNIINYVYNLTEANLTPHRRPHWFLLYDMKNSFELSDLSPTSINNLVHSMVTDKRQFLDLYSAFTYKISDPLWPKCDVECKINNVCKTVISVLWERQRCEELRRLYNS